MKQLCILTKIKRLKFLSRVLCLIISVSLNTMDFALAFPIEEDFSPLTGRTEEDQHDQFLDKKAFERMSKEAQFREKKQRSI